MTFDADRLARERAASELDTTFLVEAGAGTGKTTLLIDRILSILRERRATVKEIVAITFTEKAAGELLAKLRERLELARGEGTFAEDALAELDRARVSTIHAFAASLLRERTVEAGVDPWFEVADEIDTALLLEDAWELWFGRKGREGSTAISNALRHGIAYETIRDLAFGLFAWRDLLADVRYPEAPFSFEETIRGSVEVLGESLDAAEAGLRTGEDGAVSAVRDLLVDLASLDLSEPARGMKQFLSLAITSKMGNKGNQRNYKDPALLKDLRTAAERASAELLRLREKICYEILRDLLAELDDFFAHARAMKEDAELLDFDDLLIGARDLLRKDRGVRAYFQEQFKYVLVDEFQDTDPLQVELVFFLAEDGQRASDWREVDLVPGKLFLVGDPKQSIYRFRRADIEMYEEAKRVLAKRGEVLAITKNFRTVPRLVDVVNRTFERIIVKSADGSYQPEYIPILPGRSLSSHNEPALLLLSPLRAMPENAGKGALREEEARYIAAFVKKAVTGGYEVYDRRSDGVRRLAFGDVALLFPAFTEIEVYEEALRQHEIPYQLEGRGIFYQTQEVRSLINCLKAVENPEDELSVAAALRSEYFAVSDEELLEWKASGRRFSCMDARRDESPVPQGLGGVRSPLLTLAGLHMKRNTTPIGTLVRELLGCTKTMEALLLTRAGERSVANITKLVDVARDLESRGEPFGRIVGILENLERAGLEEMESPLSEPGQERVSLLSIHRAKGLEYPMVILANLGAEGGRESGPQILARRIGERPMLEVRVRSATGASFATLDFETERAKEKLIREAEDRRLLYVAWTRARDYLVLPTFFRDNRRTCMFDYLEPSLETIDREVGKGRNAVSLSARHLQFEESEPPVFLIPELFAPLEETAVPEGLEERTAWCTRREALIERAATGIEVVSPSRLPEAPDERQFLPDRMFSEFLSAGRPAKDLSLEERRRIARGFGSAVHAVLEHLDFGDPGVLASLSRWAARSFDLEDLGEKIEQIVQGALSMDIFARVGRARCYREYPVSAWDGEKLIEGSIDLLIEEGDGLTVVDYKTDFVEGEAVSERAEHYRPQIEAYARALETATGKMVKEASLLFLIPRALVKLAP